MKVQDEEKSPDTEEISFQLIAASGMARSLAFQALSAAKSGDFAKADELMEQSHSAGLDAHKVQTDLLTQEAQGNHCAVDVLLVHAQDHVMASMLAQELVSELIELYRNK